VLEDSGASSIYSRSLCLRGSDLGRRLPLCFGFSFILSCILLRLFMCWIHLMVDDMVFLLRCIWFPLWLLCWVIFMHDYLVIIRRRDDYFLFIYWNCMIYRLNRNRALQPPIDYKLISHIDQHRIHVMCLKSFPKTQTHHLGSFHNNTRQLILN